MRTARGTRHVAGAFVLMAAAIAVAVAPGPSASALPSGFREYTVFSGLTKPTAVELSPDGRIFVAEKRGIVKVFDNADDTTPTIVADLRTNTYNAYDRGMLGLALPPNFPTDRSIYVLYAYDAVPGGTAPRWGTAGANDDSCPSPPGPLTDGCVVQGRLSRLPLNASGVWTGQEQVLLTGWCQQFTSHSVGHLEFGPDGALYVSGGEGAGFGPADWGQRGSPRNPCGDPPGGVGATLTPPTAEGGALRAQDLRTAGDPANVGGAILRLDPVSGQGMPNNPGASSADPNVRRIVAYGFRNPFRFTLRPGTDELWIGEVGNTLWEEVDRSVGNDAKVDNFGWPCREGPARTPIYDAADLNICENLYATTGSTTGPFFTYSHGADVVAGDGCDKARGSAVTGLAIAPGDSAFPDSYDGALFLADAIRGCIWTMRADGSGTPDPATVAVFARPVGPTELEFGPDGALWYVDMYGGTIRRIAYSAGNQPPTAAIAASATSGKPPLTVFFDASGSTDPDAGDVLSYAWDLDDDGAYDDATGAVAGRNFTTAGVYDVHVRARDALGATDVATTTVSVGGTGAPVASITTPAAGLVAPVGATVTFSGRATDGAGAALPASALSWDADLLHCPSACHNHPDFLAAEGVASGSFVMPDHEYPAGVELHLTATANGRSTTVTRRVDLRGTSLTVKANIAGLPLALMPGVPLTVNDTTATSPVVRTMSTNGTVTVSAPATARWFIFRYQFVGWSDGGARTHDITVPATATTLTANYALVGRALDGATPSGPPMTLPPRPG